MAKGRNYTVVFAASLSAAQDIFEFSPADDKAIELVGLNLAQYGVGDVGDAAEELLRYSVIRGHATSGSAGSAATPAPADPGDVAASFTAEVNNTTIASGGTPVTLMEGAFNVRGGETQWFPDGFEPKASQAQGTLVIRIPAPADAITIVGTAYVREL
jgi:hypothetical protein